MSLEKSLDAVQAQVVQSGDAGELEHDHAVEAERSKWEARKASLVAQLEASSGQSDLQESPAIKDGDAAQTPTQTTLPHWRKLCVPWSPSRHPGAQGVYQ